MHMPRIGVDLGGTKIEAVILTDEGQLIERRRVPTPRDDYEATLDAIADLVRRHDDWAGRHLPVGVGTPGALEPGSQTMKNCNSTWLNGRPLLRDLERRLGERVRIANDADCFALSEAIDGAAAGCATAFGVILGTGVGGGIVIDGRLVRGPNRISGEWGHNPLPYLRDAVASEAERRLADRSCYCGRSNCVETFLSGPGLAATHAALTGEISAPEQIASAADGRCAATLDVYVCQLARALASVINVLDPDCIVLGGGLSQIERIYRDVPEQWPKFVMSVQVETQLVAARHGASGGVRGAAWLWPSDYNCDSK
jgi:fructokinase